MTNHRSILLIPDSEARQAAGGRWPQLRARCCCCRACSRFRAACFVGESRRKKFFASPEAASDGSIDAPEVDDSQAWSILGSSVGKHRRFPNVYRNKTPDFLAHYEQMGACRQANSTECCTWAPITGPSPYCGGTASHQWYFELRRRQADVSSARIGRDELVPSRTYSPVDAPAGILRARRQRVADRCAARILEQTGQPAPGRSPKASKYYEADRFLRNQRREMSERASPSWLLLSNGSKGRAATRDPAERSCIPPDGKVTGFAFIAYPAEAVGNFGRDFPGWDQ